MFYTKAVPKPPAQGLVGSMEAKACTALKPHNLPCRHLHPMDCVVPLLDQTILEVFPTLMILGFCFRAE